MTGFRVSALEARQLMIDAGYLYVDVRSEPEFVLGHPAGAYNVPWLVPDPHADAWLENPHFAAVVRASFAREQRLVIGCERGERSRAAFARLVSDGFAEIVELRPGYGGVRDAFGQVLEPGWRGAGLPCAFDAEPGRDYRALLDRALAMPADR